MDTNAPIHRYRMRSNMQPDIKHIPKTLLGALQEGDIPMTEDELDGISESLSDRNLRTNLPPSRQPRTIALKAGSIPAAPADTNAVPAAAGAAAKAAPPSAPSNMGSALADAFTSSNPLHASAANNPGAPSMATPSEEDSQAGGLCAWHVVSVLVVLALIVAGGMALSCR